MRSFKHSGDAGDIIWSLPTVRVAGGGDFFLSKSKTTRVLTSPETLRNIAPLLEAQPYIRKVDLWYGRAVAFDLDRFRAFYTETGNIAQGHLRAFGFPEVEVERAWLTVEPRHVAPVVISKTMRYPNPHFPWKAVVEKYHGQAVFVGSQVEHAAFERDFGQIPFEKTKNLLEAAQIIAGSSLHVCNQSALHCLSEGLKQTIVLAVNLRSPNCMFHRPGAQSVVGQRIELPTHWISPLVGFNRPTHKIRELIPCGQRAAQNWAGE